MKTCKKCGCVNFYASGRCKDCQKVAVNKWEAANREKVKAIKTEWNLKNHDKVRATSKASYYRHHEKNIKRAAEYVANNAEKVLATQRRYRAANADKIRLVSGAYKAANKDSIKKQRALSHLLNKEKRNAISSAYRAKNLAKVLARQAAHRKAYPERGRAANAAWKAANPEKLRSLYDLRRSRKSQAGGSFTAQDIRGLMRYQKGKCIACATDIRRSYHIDHIVPVSQMGSSNVHNLQLLCPACNQSKGAKHSIDFMQSRGFLL